MSGLQKHWDLRAALNFMLGGTGSALVAASAFLLQDGAVPLVTGMVLVAAGLGAVWLEIGRKLRAVHVFFNPFTSWMTREAFFALLLFVCGALSLYLPTARPLAGAAALAFLYCQGRILQAAKGIPAWRAPQVVALIASTGLAEGLGLALLFGGGAPLLGLFALAVFARAFAWRRYQAAVNALALEAPGRTLMGLGTVAALVLALAAFALPQLGLLAGLAGLAAAAPGWRLKHALVTRAAFKQEFSIAHLPVRGTR